MALKKPNLALRDDLPFVFCFGPRLRMHFVPKNAHYAMNKYGMNQGNPIFDVGIPRLDCSEKEEGVYRVMCVRHPLDRLVSIYSFFMKNELWYHRGHLDDQYYLNMPFEEFCEVYENTYETNIHTIPQIFYKGGQDIDFLYKYEELDRAWYDLHKMFPDLIKEKIREVGHKSKHGPWEEYYTKELRKKMEKLLVEDLELYEEAND